MKNVNLLLVAMLMLASNMVLAQELDGLTCENAIPVDTSYVGSVPAAGTYYYSASTYDLPMTCYFYPEQAGLEAPKIYVDFTCTPGVYDDPNLENMILSASGWGIKTPILFNANRAFDDNKREYYSLTINESYREIMATFGITYNVSAIVQVQAACAGEIRMAPDTTFKACVENSIWLDLPDTITTGVLHESDTYVLPFADWQGDSIRLRWTGSEAPATVWIGENCDFEFKTTGTNCALDMFVLYPDAGNEENIRNFSKQEISDYISLFGKGGVYYMRIVCAEDGELIVEKKPMDEAMAKAIPMALDQASEVAPNATEQVYYFPATWANYNMLWESSSSKSVVAYFSNNVDFIASKEDVNVIDTYTFTKELALSKKQMRAICDNAMGDNIFVKFVTTSTTTITPVLWSVGSCGEGADEIYVNDNIQLQRNATSTAWRVNINQWAEQDVKLYWEGTSSIKMFLCDTCKGFNLTKTNEHVKVYKELTINSDGSRDTVLFTKDELAVAAQYADADGFMYFRFNNSAAGSLIVMADVETPEVLDPVYTTETVTVCYGESYEWNGTTYTETGKYTQTFPAANGADSIVTLNLTVLPEVPVTEEIAAVCYGETYTWQGQEYTESGEYSVTLQDVNGCDSVITLALTVYPQTPDTTEEMTIKFGESYEWNGETYSAAGEYTTTLQDANGCNYQATLILTVLPEEKPEEDGTILLNPTDELVLNLDSAVNVYRTDYDVWSAAKVQLGWYGDKPLHVFVSKDKDFFVAIYHEDVVLYQKIEAVDPTSVEPQVLVLDMSALRAYVNDGKLYVRFLTDSDARLVIEPLTE